MGLTRFGGHEERYDVARSKAAGLKYPSEAPPQPSAPGRGGSHLV